jgi:hypothetical protein
MLITISSGQSAKEKDIKNDEKKIKYNIFILNKY